MNPNKNALLLFVASLFVFQAFESNLNAQIRPDFRQKPIYDCVEGRYYFFHGGQVKPSEGIKTVIDKSPWRMTGMVHSKNTVSGTGFYIGDRLVITHVHGLVGGARGNSYPSALSFVLAQYGYGETCNPYGKIPVKRIFVQNEWMDNVGGNMDGIITRAYDFAILELAYEPKGGKGFPAPVPWEIKPWFSRRIIGESPQAIGYANCDGGPREQPYFLYPPVISNHPENKFNNVLTQPGGGATIRMTVEACSGMSGGPVFIERRNGFHLVGVMVGSPQEECDKGIIWAAAINAEIRKRIENVRALVKLPKLGRLSQEKNLVLNNMNIHLFDPEEYMKEERSCTSYFR